MRKASIKRKTKETNIKAGLNIDGTGMNNINTSIKFFDHMLETFSKHGFFDIDIEAEGDLSHHIIEDTGIALGEAFKKAIGGVEEREKTVRFGYALIPMDDSLATCALDIGGIGGRNYTVLEMEFKREKVEDVSTENIPHFLNSFASHANVTLHISAKGKNEHHKIEAIFKALGIALDKATRFEGRKKID